MRHAALALTLAALGAALASPCRAQDFASPALPSRVSAPLAFLESGLPSAGLGFGLEAAAARWYGLPELVTRAAALGGSWRGARGVAGISQTGDPELGWTALGLGLGGAGGSGGGAVRAIARRDRSEHPAGNPLDPGLGLEAGAAAWVVVGGGVTAWASAPQVWLRGAAPPLARGLEIGLLYRGRGLGAWASRRAPPRDQEADPEHEAGLALDLGSCAAWARARDRPLRGGVGLAARARRIGAAVEIQSHPVLGESVMLALTVPAPR